ncbi:MAG: hypothetical protein FWF66_00095 [Candidatus Bathyarchaeota archaeon]|nr:hypothetical protein [Candidatus Termiticorpusculum sp.]
MSSLLVILPTSLAQIKPDIPTFTIEYPDEYGQSYLRIKNQPFTPYTNNDGNAVNLYYQARYKDPHGDEWWFINYSPSEYVKQIESQEYSIITIGMRDGQAITVQVRALVGTVTWVPHDISIYGYYKFEGVEGDWSNTQTVPLNGSASSPTASLPVTPPVNTFPANTPPTNTKPLTPNPSNIDNSNLFGSTSWVGVTVVMLLSVVVMLLAIIAMAAWRKNGSQFNNTSNPSVAKSYCGLEFGYLCRCRV